MGVLVLMNETKILSSLNYTKMKPNQEIKLEVKPNIDHLEYYSTLVIDNPDGLKLQMSSNTNKTIWRNKTDDEFYDIINKKKITLVDKNGEIIELEEDIPDNYPVDFYQNKLVTWFKEEKTYGVTNNKYYSITIKNISNRSGKVSASVYNY
ncbi:hypothetical protein [Enterococcus sp. AZ103]|uniref:hypothetical protein n=1 Tax=Enterococcus sp. AZ103 TaxID=2774628 RepID=UPI003F284B5D